MKETAPPVLPVTTSDISSNIFFLQLVKEWLVLPVSRVTLYNRRNYFQCASKSKNSSLGLLILKLFYCLNLKRFSPKILPSNVLSTHFYWQWFFITNWVFINISPTCLQVGNRSWDQKAEEARLWGPIEDFVDLQLFKLVLLTYRITFLLSMVILKQASLFGFPQQIYSIQISLNKILKSNIFAAVRILSLKLNSNIELLE